MYAVNQLPLIDVTDSQTGCCALIEPKEWDGQTIKFDDKLFAKVQTNSFLHIPLNMNSVMSETQAAIEKAGAAEKEWIILSKELSPWHAEHYFAVTKEVPGLETVRLSGTYITKVFEGPFKNAPIWHEELMDYAKSVGESPIQTYFFYTACPNCAKAYGKNYVVGFSQIA